MTTLTIQGDNDVPGTRDEVIEAARKQFADEGDITIRGLVRLSGLGAPTIYRKFRDLDTVTRVVADEFRDEALTRIKSAVAAMPEVDLGGRAAAAWRAFDNWVFLNPARHALIARHPDLHNSLRDTITRRVDLVMGEGR